MDPTLRTSTEGELLFIGNWGPTALTLFIAVSLALLALTALDLRGLPRPRLLLLMTLRTLALGAALLLLMEPALELRSVRTLPNQVPVLVDTSASMRIASEGGGSRAEVAAAQLDAWRSFLLAGDGDHRPTLYHVDEDMRRLDLRSIHDALPTDGERTHLLEALEALAEELDPRDVGAVILLSDGGDNGVLGQRTPRGAPLDADLRRRVEALGFPIHTFATSSGTGLRDIAVLRVRHEDFAFVRNAARFSADVLVVGDFGASLPVHLVRDGVRVQTRTLTLEPGRQVYTVDFEVTPETIGREIYAVEVTPQAGEALESNNAHFFLLRVIRDKVRVLHVAGRPSWDQRYLRQLLKNNPNVDLIAFHILRTDNSVQRVPQHELSLIQFPTEDLFQNELASFDVVIFQNFTHVPYHMRHFLPGIARYVRGGGALVMIGGDQSFSSGGYALTPMHDILPVELAAPTTQRSLIDDTPFRPLLTDAGQRHPITRVDPEGERNRTIWRELPPVPGTNLVLGARDDATVLLEHPDRQGAGGAAMPVMAVREVERGRTMALTIDGSFRWSFGTLAHGASPRAYASVWNNAIRWLIRDPELNLVRVDLPTTVSRPGERLQAQVRFFDNDYSPASERPVLLELYHRPLEPYWRDPPERLWQEERVTDATGRERVDVPLVQPGVYELRGRFLDTEGPAYAGSDAFLVLEGSLELRDLRPRPDLLEQLSLLSGGQHWGPAPTARIPTLRPPRAVEVDRRQVVDLWSHPGVLLFFLLLLGAEWTLRRRWGRL